MEMNTRERILQTIQKDPGTWVTAISHHLRINFTTASRHVRALEKDGVIRVEKKGNLHELFPAEPK
jgi:predicted transcriptional regulator